MTGTHPQDAVSPTAHRNTTRRAPKVGGRPDRPTAGHSLLTGIDAVLPILTAPGQSSADTRQLVEDLRAALARTAARGDTCRVHAAADSVRLAAELLLAGSTEAARQALRLARTDLADTRRRTGRLDTV
jgi:hypothetical protein